MYDSAHSVSTANPVNGSAGGDLVVDGSGTINPAALNNGTSFSFPQFLVSYACVRCNFYTPFFPPVAFCIVQYTPFCRTPQN